jgi:hypothetical protein
MLAILQAPGVAADVSLALDWYEKAQELGSREARQRLRLLTEALAKPKRHVVPPPAHQQRPHEAHGIYVAGADPYPDPLMLPPAFIQ